MGRSRIRKEIKGALSLAALVFPLGMPHHRFAQSIDDDLAAHRSRLSLMMQEMLNRLFRHLHFLHEAACLPSNKKLFE